MTMTLDSERAAFEGWFYASKYAQVALPTDGDVQRAWDAWQARAHLSQPARVDVGAIREVADRLIYTNEHGLSQDVCHALAGKLTRALSTAQAEGCVPDSLVELSAQASPDWKVGVRRLGGGAVVGGDTFEYAQGSGQTQIASFTCPRLADDDPRDPSAIQRANAALAVECVKFVRSLISVHPAPDNSNDR